MSYGQTPETCNGAHTLYLSGSGTTVWPGSVNPNWSFKSIVVGTNHTLIVPAGAVIKFTKIGVLEVMKNATLKLNGTLTSCNSFWQGVRLRGDVCTLELNLNTQSSFIGGNEAKIENAIEGIGAWSQKVGFCNSKGTGKISCNGTTFLNNLVSVKIKPYRVGMLGPIFLPYMQIAKFVDCDFKRDENSFFSWNINFVVLKGVVADGNPKAVYFDRCKFQQSETNASHTIRGVLSIASKLQMNRCYFSTLTKGVEVLPSPAVFIPWINTWIPGASQTYSITHSYFTQCALGIHNSANTGANIEYNYFSLGKIPSIFNGKFETPVVGANQQVGVYFGGGTNGFKFHKNTFWRVHNLSDVNAISFGSYFRDIGGNSKNVVTDNWYVELDFGNFTEKYNGNSHAGLTFICNDLRGSKKADFFALDNSSSIGHRSMRLDQGLPLGSSKFAPALNLFSIHKNVDFFAWTQSNYNYYLPKNASPQRIYPKKYYGTTLKYVPEDNAICGTEFKRFPDEAKLTDAEKITNRNNYFINRLSFQVAKSEYESNGSASEKEAARKAMTYYRQEMDVAAYLGYNNSVSRDSSRVWMGRFDNPIGDYMLVEDNISAHEYENAMNILNAMPDKYDFSVEALEDHTKVSDIYNMLISADGADLSENAIQSLEEYADLPDGQTRYLARNILTAKGYFFMPSIANAVLPEEMNSNNTPADILPRMIISPNPVDYNANFDWRAFDVEGKEISIEITNQTGGLVRVLHPDASTGSIEWTTESISGGICYYRLLINGVEADSGFFVVNK